MLVQVCKELPGSAPEHVVDTRPDDGHAQERDHEPATALLKRGCGDLGALGFAVACSPWSVLKVILASAR
jgi:hypothetical protein